MWTKQRTKQGDTIASLAKAYNTTVEKILRANSVATPAMHTDKYLSVKSKEYGIPVNIPRKILSKLILECDIQRWVRNAGGDCSVTATNAATSEWRKLARCIPGAFCSFTKDTEIVLPVRARGFGGLGSVVDLYNLLQGLQSKAKAYADAVVSAAANAASRAWRDSFLSALEGSLVRAMQRDSTGLYKFETNKTLIDNITKMINEQTKIAKSSFPWTLTSPLVMDTTGVLLQHSNNIRAVAGVTAVIAPDKKSDGLDSIRNGSVVLKKGAKGVLVENVQLALKNTLPASALPPKFKVDGIFGPKTETAVKTFQRAAKMKVTGTVDATVIAALDSGKISVPAGSKVAGSFSSSSVSLSDVRAGKGTLSRGQSGAGVTELQTLLAAALNTTALKIDGKFGPETEQAVRALQKVAVLPETGVADQNMVSAADRVLSMSQQPAASSNTALYVVGASVVALAVAGLIFSNKKNKAA